jgi:hypothetical protein
LQLLHARYKPRRFRFHIPSLLLILSAVATGCSTPVNTVPVSPASPTVAPSTLPSGATPTPTPTTSAAPTPTPQPTGTSSVAACTGQTTGASSANVTQTLATAGGSLCIPAFGGFGGSIAYPTSSNAVNITLTSSTTNTAGYPALGSTTPIFYLGISLAGGTTFGTGAPAGGGLAAPSATIVPGQTYTVYGQATLLGVPVNFSPCQSVATAGGGGTGVISGLGTVLKNVSVPISASGVLEIEPGASGSGPC